MTDWKLKKKNFSQNNIKLDWPSIGEKTKLFRAIVGFLSSLQPIIGVWCSSQCLLYNRHLTWIRKTESQVFCTSLQFSFSYVKTIYLSVKQSKAYWFTVLERKQSYITRATQTTPETVQTVADSLNDTWTYKWR